MSLTVAGTDIPVADLTEGEPFHEGRAEYGRNAAGKPVDLSYGVKRVFQLTTPWLNASDYDAVIAILEDRSAQAIGGTLIPFTSGRARVLAVGIRDGAGFFERAIRAEVLEE